MNKIRYIILFVLFRIDGRAQQFNTKMWCHRNVYDPVMSGASCNKCIDATFNYHTPNGWS